MFETNLFGAAEVLQRVVPGMREAGGGRSCSSPPSARAFPSAARDVPREQVRADRDRRGAGDRGPPLRHPGVDGRAGDGGHRLLRGGAPTGAAARGEGPTPLREDLRRSRRLAAHPRDRPRRRGRRGGGGRPRPRSAVPDHRRRRRATARGHARGHARRPRLPRRAPWSTWTSTGRGRPREPAPNAWTGAPRRQPEPGQAWVRSSRRRPSRARCRPPPPPGPSPRGCGWPCLGPRRAPCPSRTAARAPSTLVAAAGGRRRPVVVSDPLGRLGRRRSASCPGASPSWSPRRRPATSASPPGSATRRRPRPTAPAS